MNKIHELQVALEMYNAKIGVVTETHLNSDIVNAELKLKGFQIFRKDRNTGKNVVVLVFMFTIPYRPIC